jgi:chloramphenicol O-acetyltransferase type A
MSSRLNGAGPGRFPVAIGNHRCEICAMARPIDLAQWKRKLHFDLYQKMAQPFFNVCAEVDVTRVWEQCRRDKRISFTLASLYLGSRAANAIEALRLRVRGKEVWVHDVVHFSTTVIRPDNTFAFARVEHRDNFHDFSEDGREVLERARTSSGLEIPEKEDDAIYHSILPWIRFTAFSNPIHGPEDCFPRIVYGKVGATGDRWMMPVGVEVHHALVDGYDVAKFFEQFQAELSIGITRP